MQRQVQLKALIDSFQLLVAAVPLNLPIAIPDATEGFAHRGDARAGSIGAFGVIKLPAIQITQREMREVKILHLPGSNLSGIAADGLPEESQFEPKPPVVGPFQISGVVPPFGLKIRMIEMISRELVMVSRQGGAVLRRKRLQKKHRGGDAGEPTLHARPQADSSAPLPSQGRDPQAR